jgi:AraC-like DNA-binding protein
VPAVGVVTPWWNDRPTVREEPPSGRVSVVISDGAPFLIEADGVVVRASSFVVGMFDRPARTTTDGPAWGVQVDLDPAAAFALGGGEVAALANRVRPLAEVTAVDTGRVLERVAAADTAEDVSAAVVEELAHAVDVGPTLSPPVRVAWGLCTAVRPPAVASVAEEIGWSRAHLVRRFVAEIGLPPRTVMRLARFRRALRMLDTARPLAAIAVTAGYADQAHMNREFKAFAGMTPGHVRASAAEATFVQDEQRSELLGSSPWPLSSRT